MIAEDHFLEGFARPLAPQDAGKPLPELTVAIPALELPAFQLQHRPPQP